MSFYTSLTGLNAAQTELSVTSNNIANSSTTSFKRSDAEFGDIFASSTLQRSASGVGSGTVLLGINQQFSQGNIESSSNALDLAVTVVFSIEKAISANAFPDASPSASAVAVAIPSNLL